MRRKDTQNFFLFVCLFVLTISQQHRALLELQVGFMLLCFKHLQQGIRDMWGTIGMALTIVCAHVYCWQSWEDRLVAERTGPRWRLLLTSGGAKRRVFSKQYVCGNVMCGSFRTVLCVWNMWYWYPEWRTSKTQNNSVSSVVNLQHLLGTALG